MFGSQEAAEGAQREARREPSAAQKVHHYTHVVVALCEGLKELPDHASAKDSVNATVTNVCNLINTLVASEMPGVH